MNRNGHDDPPDNTPHITPDDAPGNTSASAYRNHLEAALDAMFDEELEESTIALSQQINALRTQLAIRVAELERRDIPRSVHGLSGTGWLARFCSMTRYEASGTLKTGRALSHMPLIAERALRGEVPNRSVRLLAQTRDRYPSEFVAHEPVFADAATYLSPSDLRHAVDYWEQQVNYDLALDDVKSVERLRSLYISNIGNGLHDIRGTLTTETAHIVTTALAALTNPANLDAADIRTPAQRRHDAFGDVCRFFIDHNESITTSGGEKPHITVTVPYDILVGDILTGTTKELPQLDGNPIDPETIRRLACDAGIVRIITDSHGQPLDVGRRVRTATPAIRRAVEHRDKGCVWPGCGAPSSWCDVHHIIHWSDGGATSLENSELLCRRHHTDTHNGRARPIAHRDTRLDDEYRQRKPLIEVPLSRAAIDDSDDERWGSSWVRRRAGP